MEKTLNQNFWDKRYQENKIGWDLGQVSPPIQSYIDGLTDKTLRILIPGAGNAYEAHYLAEKGFTNVTVIDIAPTLVNQLQNRFQKYSGVTILQGDFFEHVGIYDLILEQTFFCAIDPTMRDNYVRKMNELLVKGGKLVGLLFNRQFEGGPPFGGDKTEYQQRFAEVFDTVDFTPCITSHPARLGSEVWMEIQK